MPTIHKFWKYRAIFLRYRWSLLVGVLALIATNLIGAAIPWLVKGAVNTLEQHGSADRLHETLLTIFGLAILMLGIRITSRMTLLGVGRKIEHDLRNRLYGHLLTLPTPYFVAHPTGELMSRLTNDVGSLRYLSGGGVMLGVNTIVAYLTTLPMMFAISPWLTLTAFILYPVTIYTVSRLSKKVKDASHQVQEELGDISAIAQENLSGMAVIQSYVKEGEENRRFEKACQQYFDAYQSLISQRIWVFLLMALVSGLSLLAVLLEGGREVILREMNVGGFIAFTLYLERLAWPTMAIGWTISIFQQGVVALERVDEVLGVSPPEQARYEEIPPPEKSDLEIRHLDFSYASVYEKAERDEPSPTVLRDVNLTLPTGSLVAFVGPLGSGKSTLLSLIPRLYDVPDGKILWGGRDINHIPVEKLRRAIAFMPQHSFLFSDSIFQNMAYGKPDAPEPFVHETAELASVHAEVLAFPDRYATVVGERGMTLSGGQRQRVTLTRALLLEPRILILDDPFSNVDAETERQIVEALLSRKVFADKTTLLATHRFALVRNADLVVLMDAGRVVATGTHAELLETQPLYQNLNRLEQLHDQQTLWEGNGHGDNGHHGDAKVLEEFGA